MSADRNGDPAAPAEVTVDQVVAWNLAWHRQQAGLKQRELAERLGWPENKISEAERSWKGGRTREFNAQLLADLAGALGVPLIALFLPPEGERVSVPSPGGRIGAEGLMRLVLPDRDGDEPAVKAYRARLEAATAEHLGRERELDAWRRSEDKKVREARRVQLLAYIEGLDAVRAGLAATAAAIAVEDAE